MCLVGGGGFLGGFGTYSARIGVLRVWLGELKSQYGPVWWLVISN